MSFKVTHVVVTDEFAGVERYVATTAAELARRGGEISVVGGSRVRMPAALGDAVNWLPGGTPYEALRSLARLGKQDICHVHMTLAEATAMVARPVHKAPILSTRHFAAPRGSSPAARLLRPLIAGSLAREIATSHFVASRTERVPDRVLTPGVPESPNLWRVSNRVVLVLQRLEPEKDTLTALRAWMEARLWDEGWSMRIVGDGSQRAALKSWTTTSQVKDVTFVEWSDDVQREFRLAAMLVAPTPAEGFGLGVVEAMAAGLPVVAVAQGGHLETVGCLRDAALFPQHDAEAAAAAMRSMVDDDARAAVSAAGRELAQARFSIAHHVDRLTSEYVQIARRKQARTPSRTPELTELVVCSLEEWDEVWRRNQFFVDVLLRRNPSLRVLFVEPPTDPLHELSAGRRPAPPQLRTVVGYDGRLAALRPLKVLPRRVGATADSLLRAQVRLAARRLGFSRPILWINDVTYAPLVRSTDWSSLYDVTDDWLAAPFPDRELARLSNLERIALDDADEVVVCSEALADSRGRTRRVHLVPNAVDVDHFRRPRPRPTDLPKSPVAVYVGTLHESRLDSDLLLEAARTAPEVTFALVGPDALAPSTRRRLATESNVHLLGARSYEVVPGYLQHADVIVVPHLVNRFTDSLDPIKAYECIAVGRPTVATPVAGFRSLAEDLSVVPTDCFASEVHRAMTTSRRETPTRKLMTWVDRATAFESVLLSAAGR